MVALKCVDPLNGVARESEFLPTVASLVAWCEHESAFLRGQIDREELQQQRVREQQQRADEAVQLAERLKGASDIRRAESEE